MSTDNQDNQDKQVNDQPKEVVRGDRGAVGEPTASLSIKQLWHQTHFKRADVGDKHNPRKRQFVKNHHAPSLKRFARELMRSGNELALEWLARKGGSLNAKRTKENVARVQLEKQKTKESRRKTK